MWLYLIIFLLFVGVAIFIYYKFFYNKNNIPEKTIETTETTELQNDHDNQTNMIDNSDQKDNNSEKENNSPKENNNQTENNNQKDDDENSYTGTTNNEKTTDFLFDNDDKQKKINIYASYECGSIAGSLTSDLIFSKNMDEKEKWLFNIIEKNTNVISGHIHSISNDKYWGADEQNLILLHEPKFIFEFIFGLSAKSNNVCNIKVKDNNKYIELSKEGKLMLVDNLNQDNFKYKVVQIDE